MKTMQERLQETHAGCVIEDSNEDSGRRRTRSSLRATPTSTEKSPVPTKRARTATTPTSAKKGRTPAKKNLNQVKDEEEEVVSYPGGSQVSQSIY